MHPTEKREENQYIIFDGSLSEDISAADFDIATYEQQGNVTGKAAGRGTTYFVRRGELQCVLRHYHRGGLMAKFSNDRYWWSGLYRTRSFCEWYLLVKLKDRELPVPRAVAARVVRRGLFYTADLITETIENSQSLSTRLVTEPLSDTQWRKLGSVLRRFHQRGVYHADLNAHNILWAGEDQVYLLDFDKGELRETRRSWQLANLNRLRRSFDKLAQQHGGYHFSDECWSALIAGYTQL